MNSQLRTYLFPALIVAGVGLLLLSQLRATIGHTGEAAEGVIDQIGTTAGDIVGSAGDAIGQAAGSADPGHPDGPAPSGSRKPLDPVKLIDGLAGTVGQVIEIGDVIGDEAIGLTLAEEIALGRDYHQQLMNDPETQRSGDTAMLRWVEELAKPFLRQRVRTQDMDYTFTLLEDDMVNAFSHIGGYVYVCRGLLEAMDYDPHAVKFVIGHEIAHVELRQCARRVYAQHRLNELGGAPIAAIGGVVHRNLQVNYSQEDELDCDKWSYLAMRRMGHSKPQGRRATEVMLALEQAAGQDGHKHAPRDAIEALARAVDEHFCTHPSAVERLEQLDQLD